MEELVVISRNGIVTFFSYLLTVQVSDKELTKYSRLLKKLGDNIMADRGFDITDNLPSGVTLNIAAFKGGRDQLNPEKTDETARITAMRIHVEWAIGLINN